MNFRSRSADFPSHNIWKLIRKNMKCSLICARNRSVYLHRHDTTSARNEGWVLLTQVFDLKHPLTLNFFIRSECMAYGKPNGRTRINLIPGNRQKACKCKWNFGIFRGEQSAKVKKNWFMSLARLPLLRSHFDTDSRRSNFIIIGLTSLCFVSLFHFLYMKICCFSLHISRFSTQFSFALHKKKKARDDRRRNILWSHRIVTSK